MAAPALASRPARSTAPDRRSARPSPRGTGRPAKKAAARPAAATARPRSAARSARAADRSPHPRRFAQPAAAGAALLPHAAARTAGAVRDLSDSSLIVRLTATRGWIALLGALLAGIVALNVLILSLNAGSGEVSQRISQLDRENSALRGELAERLSADRIEDAAGRLGMVKLEPRNLTDLSARPGDAKRAAAALAAADPG